MQMSRRALRMERHHKRTKRSGSGLNLVSMMDIFTILVFFLLVSSGETEVLPNPKDIQLPESAALERARETVVVMVTGDRSWCRVVRSPRWLPRSAVRAW